MTSRVVAVKSRAPRFLKAPYRLAASVIPYRWRQGPHYRRTMAFLRREEGWSEQERREYLCHSLRQLVRYCVEHVPYYRSRFEECGVDVNAIRSIEDIRELPFIDAVVVAAGMQAMTADNVPRRDWWKASTGGTTGTPVPFYLHKRVTYQRNLAYFDYFMQWHGWRPGAPMIVLRNDVLPKRVMWDYSRLTRKLRLDPFKLTPETVGQYLDTIIESGIEHLHTYPSAAASLFRLAREAGDTRRTPLRRIVVTSENVYPGQREFLEESSGAKVVSMYGHSESCVFACECDRADGYHVFHDYGLLELIDGDGLPIDRPNVPGEIVGTGFGNPVMPLLRYRTADFSQYMEGDYCPCGCPYPRIGSIQGRWMDEVILRPDGARVCITALNLHSSEFDHARKFQFVQEERDSILIRVVPGEDFTARDEEAIREAVGKMIGPSMHITVRRVDDIPTTPAGKFRFLIQKLDTGDAGTEPGRPAG
jgi:phenylacetate-CoA ligase